MKKRINEVALEDDGVDIPYHDSLNHFLWDEDQTMKESVRDRLLEIGDLFVEYLDIPEEAVLDYTVTGSMANYNWTNYSDIDLHVILDMEVLRGDCEGYVDEYLQSKRKLWNDRHQITIYGYEVEAYPQDGAEPHISTGVYSLFDDEFITQPTYDPPTVDEMSVETKAKDMIAEIEDLTNAGCDDLHLLEEMKHKISTMRKAGLDRAGEFSTENLVFKILRNQGYIGKLFECYQEAMDKMLSLQENCSCDEKPLDKKTPSLSELVQKHGVSKSYLKQQLRKGIEVEYEHTSDRAVAKEIALDHLNELPDY